MTTAAQPQTPLHDPYSIPHPNESGAMIRGYSGVRSSSRPSSYAGPSSTYNPSQEQSTQLAHNPRFREDFEAASRRSSILMDGQAGGSAPVQRSASVMSRGPSRSGTLQKKSSLSRKSSLRRSGSRRSTRAGSVRSLSLGARERYNTDGEDDVNNVFAVPIPTHGNPTEVLADRFQAWRKVLKDLIAFFKDIQKSYETRAKLFQSATSVMGNHSMPPNFLESGGLADTHEILQHFHRQGLAEAQKAADVEVEVISQLTGLRSDLQKKTKEIKSLSGDFKNTVDKEVEGTRKAVRNLHEALGLVDTDPSATSGKGDPFLQRLNVERQVEKQIEEENYLHRAYLNLENSGRELESIVVSEIQKAYNAYASILKKEADEAYDTVEKLRAGPISMPQDHEWNAFVATSSELVDPRIPLRNVDNVTYDGIDHPAAAEVRAGMLERKSKYLKSYTPGWYVLSPTHLHEFKSADRVAFQTPVMSLYLPEQKVGTHSEENSSSHKFLLKGRQTGAMHRGHSWVFRAESHETMMEWYHDIAKLCNSTGEARNAFVRQHVRSVSGRSTHSDVMEDDEADQTPYSAGSVVLAQERPTSATRQPGGAFPSDVQIDRQLAAPMSPSSENSSNGRDMIAAAAGLPDGTGEAGPARYYGAREPQLATSDAREIDDGSTRVDPSRSQMNRQDYTRHGSYYGDWMGPAAILAVQQQNQQKQAAEPEMSDYQERPEEQKAVEGFGGDAPASGQRVRPESVSTVPTNTNGTDYTYNTMATSIDESPELGPKGTAVASSSTPTAAIPLPIRNLEEESPASKPDSANIGQPTRAPLVQLDSVLSIDQKIPGRYPPTNVAA
ncbi:Uncharacterized protein PECH_005396 [Penicillium ucsense]|uniref:PH domain-containing protein n=1 Tax=Penicillium ucsense TaxID=2839758 RepID=A0A8J8WGS5_9EURO|nr:Uncharacterized protein PECM_007606 [Penicillium ucsense]KAF7736419.1 Uncharacterized protein PECH_005396 [Penicillium ucsense]